jgi:hypothetical protein
MSALLAALAGLVAGVGTFALFVVSLKRAVADRREFLRWQRENAARETFTARVDRRGDRRRRARRAPRF